jgi:hypothetical protein
MSLADAGLVKAGWGIEGFAALLALFGWILGMTGSNTRGQDCQKEKPSCISSSKRISHVEANPLGRIPKN